MILSKHYFFQNTKISDISPQIIGFKNLDDTVVIFQALQTSAASLTSVASATSLASTASKAIFPQKNSWSWWFGHHRHQNDQYFCRMDHQKSNFLPIYGTIFYRRLLRQAYVTFLKTQMPKPQKYTNTYLHYDLNAIFSWFPRSSKNVKASSNTL